MNTFLRYIFLFFGIPFFVQNQKNLDENIIKLSTSADFANKIENERYVIVSFYVNDCEYCEHIHSTYSQLAKELKNTQNPQIIFAAIEKKQNELLFKNYKITKFPTFVFFLDGEPIFINKSNPLKNLEKFIAQCTKAKIFKLDSKTQYKSLEQSKNSVLLAMEKKNEIQLKKFRAVAAVFPSIQFYYTYLEYIKNDVDLKNKYNYIVFTRSQNGPKIFSWNDILEVSIMRNFLDEVLISGIIHWSEDFHKKIVEEKQNSIFWFIEKTNPKILKFEKSALTFLEKIKSEFKFCLVDISTKEGKQVADSFGFEEKMNVLLLIEFRIGEVVKYQSEFLDMGSFEEFFNDYKRELLFPYFKSEKEPILNKEEKIQTIVGKNFRKVIYSNNDQFFVLLSYFSGSESSEKARVLLREIEKEFSGRDEILFGEINVARNEHYLLRNGKIPGIKVFVKNKKFLPREFNEEFSFEGLIAFIRNVLNENEDLSKIEQEL